MSPVDASVSLCATMGDDSSFVDDTTYKHVLDRLSFGPSAFSDDFVTYSV